MCDRTYPVVTECRVFDKRSLTDEIPLSSLGPIADLYALRDCFRISWPAGVPAARPIESYNGARPGNHYRGPYHNLISYAPRSRRRRHREGGTMGRSVPHHLTRGLGERPRRKLSQWGPGRSPGRKWILCIFEVRKKPSGTPFLVYLSDGGPPKCRWARENSPPPLDGPARYICQQRCGT